MLLLELEEQIKPLSQADKQELFRFLARELQQEAVVTEESPVQQDGDFQPDPAKLRLLSAIAPRPYWPLHDAHEAAKTLFELKGSGGVPVI